MHRKRGKRCNHRKKDWSFIFCKLLNEKGLGCRIFLPQLELCMTRLPQILILLYFVSMFGCAYAWQKGMKRDFSSDLLLCNIVYVQQNWWVAMSACCRAQSQVLCCLCCYANNKSTARYDAHTSGGLWKKLQEHAHLTSFQLAVCGTGSCVFEGSLNS